MKRLACLLLASACGYEPLYEPAPSEVLRESLTPLNSCGDVEQVVRLQLIRDMEAQLDGLRDDYLAGEGSCLWVYEDALPTAGGPSPSAAQRATGGGANDYTTTNNQVAGVDEADFIKNDSKYFYVAANGHLQVFDAFPPESAHRISHLQLDGEPFKLFVEDGRAVVFARKPGPYTHRTCTYGYDCELRGEPGPTLVHFVDLRELDAPKLTRSIELGGGLLAARRVGDTVYTAVSFTEARVPGLQTWPSDLPYCLSNFETIDVMRAWDALKIANRRAILAANISNLLPVVRDVDSGENLLGGCEGFFSAGGGAATTSVFAFNLTGQGRVGGASIVSRPGAVFANERSLYVTTRQPHSRPETSSIHRFSLHGRHVAYSGSAAVAGHVLNQFSMDEFEGHLRVATSVGRVPDPGVHSAVTVFDARGPGLTQTGVVSGIAPTEDIRSVRFVGKRGYLVTFKKTDPLFTVDLSVPAAPRVMGELKIPGFSTYMHPVGTNHLLAIGFEAEERGSFAYFQGLQLQFFDVSKPTQPMLLHKEVIGTRGSASAATSDHLAFNYFSSKELLGLPMAICENSAGGASYGRLTFDGLLVFKASLANGFTRLGGVAHGEPEAQAGRGCYNWWSTSTTHVQRSVFMDDVVYSVAPDVIRVQHVGELGADVAALSLTVD